MTRQRWTLPLLVVLVASAVPLLQVGWDRLTGRHATVTFSQRELPLGYLESDNNATTLQWSWWRAPELDSVPLARVESFGLGCRRSDFDCGQHGSRRGWVVVGLDTRSWQAAIDSLQRRITEIRHLPATDTTADAKLRDAVSQLTQVVQERSRLALVAVGSDPDSLAAAYDDGHHLVLRARLHASRSSWPRDTLPGETPYYRVDAVILPSQLNVPARWAALVDDSSGYHTKRYDVTIAVGGGWLPRVVNIEPFTVP